MKKLGKKRENCREGLLSYEMLNILGLIFIISLCTHGTLLRSNILHHKHENDDENLIQILFERKSGKSLFSHRWI